MVKAEWKTKRKNPRRKASTLDRTPEQLAASAKRQGLPPLKLDWPPEKLEAARKMYGPFTEAELAEQQRRDAEYQQAIERIDRVIHASTFRSAAEITRGAAQEVASSTEPTPTKVLSPKEWFEQACEAHPRKQGEGATAYAKRLTDKHPATGVTKPWSWKTVRRRVHDRQRSK
jgi:hypothetical protein